MFVDGSNLQLRMIIRAEEQITLEIQKQSYLRERLTQMPLANSIFVMHRLALEEIGRVKNQT